MSPILDTDRLIRPTTAAAILGVTRDGIHKRITAGTLQAIPIDGHLYLDRAAVEAVASEASAITGSRKYEVHALACGDGTKFRITKNTIRVSPVTLPAGYPALPDVAELLLNETRGALRFRDSRVPPQWLNAAHALEILGAVNLARKERGEAEIAPPQRMGGAARHWLAKYCNEDMESHFPLALAALSRPRGGGSRRKSTPATRGRVSEPSTSPKRKSRRGTGG